MDGKRNHDTHLWKKGLSLLCIMALAVCPFSGCTLKSAYQKEEEKPQGELDIYQKIELTEEEMEQSHFTMDDFKDKVRIDAKITPYHMYKDETDVYYNLFKGYGGAWGSWRTWSSTMSSNKPIQLDKRARDARAEDLTYFGKSVKEILKLFETENGRKPQAKKMKWKFNKKYGEHEIYVPFTMEGDTEDILLEMRWECPSVEKSKYEKNKYLINSKELYPSSFRIKGSETADQARMLVNNIQMSHIPYDEEKNLSFADAGETAQMLKEKLTMLTGYAFSEDYDMIPVDSTIINDSSEDTKKFIKDIGTLDASSYANQIKPCYYYRFYQELDGLPIKPSNTAILAGKDTNLSESLREEIKDSTEFKTQIDHCCSAYAEIIYDDTGIIYLEMGDGFASDLAPCEKRKPIMNLSELLESLNEYFDTVVSIDTIVFDIRLAYLASFTDGEDEPIRRVLTPVWIVKYDTQITGKRCQRVFFDGYTGAPLHQYLNIY